MSPPLHLAPEPGCLPLAAMLRVLSWQWLDGPANMAWDEALLQAATEPTLRLYGWQPATVSLGYFQQHDPIQAQLPAAMPVVRRITGGGAIWHEHEVTYGLVGHLGQGGLPEKTKDVYPLLHRAIAATVAAAGGNDLGSQSETVGDRRYMAEPRCFASPAAEDLVHGDGKVLGSAGRTRGDRLLVHGSLKLASNTWDQGVVTGCGLERAVAAQALIDGVVTALGADGTVESAPTAAEQAAYESILAARYGSDDWVVHRKGPRA